MECSGSWWENMIWLAALSKLMDLQSLSMELMDSLDLRTPLAPWKGKSKSGSEGEWKRSLMWCCIYWWRTDSLGSVLCMKWLCKWPQYSFKVVRVMAPYLCEVWGKGCQASSTSFMHSGSSELCLLHLFAVSSKVNALLFFLLTARLKVLLVQYQYTFFQPIISLLLQPDQLTVSYSQ